ncbi:plastocyanin/azurin family copper-binding protein [Dyadobacter sp. 676]|uniref:Plastocyanin/azurin family copper-binding protein n=1 Tax=Dyadobacter sp. 676 TaxID=3088362 RepID=A0AAU8FNR2_9BACT
MTRSQVAGLAILLLATGPIAAGRMDIAPAESTSPVARNHVVEIKQMAFSPAHISVQKGDRITFVNHDIVVHDITEANKAWRSSPLPVGKSWSLTVRQNADYYCSIHPVMKGKITVK